ncbi:AlpA family transcriptional regulator [Francisella tularensis subsp. novicida]|uniref:AlpA family transcriptional regulator n=3 Tax=Francisella TaxID=262 RepID=A0A6I4RQ47_FRATU|nr:MULTISPECIES: AlpA family transcriptional regulator [Francisella]ABK88926.1 regulatory protein, AlpA family [Francisella tularensis subsp. novicida U112]AJI44578.1 prophage CP4-57 regulatory family protein [Francisella tularensis subsp. novicida F6168]AJI47517.1 prophage CP4-57 regulatory family protein [Francisella philomiragia]AJI50110.1 prophage CP4-57 regulatory family protein [Francisella philomiragia]AJI61004.1 prophage CP4-57 regulatory family protein [Francisella tularensis subsp. n
MKILRLKQVVEMTGTSKTTIYRWINANQFPKPINLSHASVGWLEADINDWIQSKIQARG